MSIVLCALVTVILGTFGAVLDFEYNIYGMGPIFAIASASAFILYEIKKQKK